MTALGGTPHTVETSTSTLQLDIWTSAGKCSGSGTNVTLKVVLLPADPPSPGNAAAPKRGVIILHPWAKLGGSMEDPTVLYNFM